MNQPRPTLAAALATAILLGTATTRATEPLTVTVTLALQSNLLARIAGERVSVNVLIPRSADPHTLEVTPSQVAGVGRSRIYFHLGMPIELRLADRLRGSRDLIVADTTAGLGRRVGECTHEHHHEHGHPEEADPHIWLTPSNLTHIAAAMARALAEIDPAGGPTYRERLAAFIPQMEELDADLRARLTPFRGQAFLVYHPAFGYFADAYGLRQESVETGGKPPTPRQLAHLAAKMRERGVRTVFAQPQFDPRSAEALARTIGGTVRDLDPMAADVPANLRAIGERIAESMQPRPTGESTDP